MKYLLRRTDEPDGRKGEFVSPPGSPRAYVSRKRARVFDTREEAEAERCPGNEVVHPIGG